MLRWSGVLIMTEWVCDWIWIADGKLLYKNLKGR
jgi:hypothetical protein